MSLPRLFLNRVSVETKKLSQDLPPEITCWPEEEDKIGNFRAVMKGPLDSPYAGGIFTLRIVLPQRYPHEPPKVNFLTRIYHPNVDDKGRICLDILKSVPKGTWTSGQNIMSTLMSIYSLLSNPNADDPLDIEAATLFKNDRLLFNETVKKITKKHATGEDTEKSLDEDLDSVPLELIESETSVKRQMPVFSLKKGKPSIADSEKVLPTLVSNDLLSSKTNSMSDVPKKQNSKIFSLKKLKENIKDLSTSEPCLPKKELPSYSNSSPKKPDLNSPQKSSNQSPLKDISKGTGTSDPKFFPSGLKKNSCSDVSNDITSSNNSKPDACENSLNKKKLASISSDYKVSQIGKTSVQPQSTEAILESKNIKSTKIIKRSPADNDDVNKTVLKEISSKRDACTKDSGDSKTRVSSENKVSQLENLSKENHLKAKISKLKTVHRKTTDNTQKKDALNLIDSVIPEAPVLVVETQNNLNLDKTNVSKSIIVAETNSSLKNNNEDKFKKNPKTGLSRQVKPSVILSSGENTPLQSISPTHTKKSKITSKIIHRLPTPNLDGPLHPMKAVYDVCKSTSPGSSIHQPSTNSKSKTINKIDSLCLDKESISPKHKSHPDEPIGNDKMTSNKPNRVISSMVTKQPLTELQISDIKPSELPLAYLSISKDTPLVSSTGCLSTEEVPQNKKRLHSEDDLPIEKQRGWRPSPLRPIGKGVQDGSGQTRRLTFNLKKLRKN